MHVISFDFLFIDFNDVLKKINKLKALNMFAAKHYCEHLLKEFSQIYSSTPSKVCSLLAIVSHAIFTCMLHVCHKFLLC